jgi:hydroxysqualene dehydroxylase
MKVLVVGGGFAGFAAAVALQERRHQVVLLERRGVLGGRATSSRDAVTGDDVDNGTHLMVGAYRETLSLARHAGAGDLLLEQEDLRLEWVSDRGRSVLHCPPLPAPLHLLAGLLGLRVPLAVKLQAARLGLAVRFGRRPDALTLAEYFAACGQGEEARRLLWDPLALAILNEPPERAAAVLFHRVYEEAFLRDRRLSRLVFLRRGWGVLLGRIARYFESRGGVVRRGTRVESLVPGEDGRVRGARLAERPREREAIASGAPPRLAVEAADAVVCAVPPDALAAIVPAEWRSQSPFDVVDRFGGAPIVSVDLWLDRVVVDGLMLGLRDSEVEWVFDKGRLFGREGAPQHLSFIVSAAYRSAAKANVQLVAAAEGALRRYFPAMSGASVERALVLREPRATFASSPELERLRPGPRTPVRGLYLAGDWTATGLPATIEGAVRSGAAAAAAILRTGSAGAVAGSR